MQLLHINLKDISISFRSIGIGHMNVDNRKNLTWHIKGRIMHLKNACSKCHKFGHTKARITRVEYI